MHQNLTPMWTGSWDCTSWASTSSRWSSLRLWSLSSWRHLSSRSWPDREAGCVPLTTSLMYSASVSQVSNFPKYGHYTTVFQTSVHALSCNACTTFQEVNVAASLHTNVVKCPICGPKLLQLRFKDPWWACTRDTTYYLVTVTSRHVGSWHCMSTRWLFLRPHRNLNRLRINEMIIGYIGHRP